VKGRHEARRLAINVLYEADIRDQLPVDAFLESEGNGWSPLESDEKDAQLPAGGSVDYARVLVTGIQEQQSLIDELITSHADRWAIQRMPVVDRTILRIGVYELFWNRSVPTAVVINEAVDLAKELSTEESGKFVNGLLGRLAEVAALDGE
jgi:N utilization substance protein B